MRCPFGVKRRATCRPQRGAFRDCALAASVSSAGPAAQRVGIEGAAGVGRKRTVPGVFLAGKHAALCVVDESAFDPALARRETAFEAVERLAFAFDQQVVLTAALRGPENGERGAGRIADGFARTLGDAGVTGLTQCSARKAARIVGALPRNTRPAVQAV